jgi:hypothetical protein
MMTHQEISKDSAERLLLAAQGPRLLVLASALCASTSSAARASDDNGQPLLWCLIDVLNPCWAIGTPVVWPLKHWSGLGAACRECSMRAAVHEVGGGRAVELAERILAGRDAAT